MKSFVGVLRWFLVGIVIPSCTWIEGLRSPSTQRIEIHSGFVVIRTFHVPNKI